jgi:hypothetical protein
MLITSSAPKKEIKVWQCGVTSGGKYEAGLFRSVDVNEFIDYDGIDISEQPVAFWMECHPSFDGTKIILGAQLSYPVGLKVNKRGFINVIDIDTGRGTQYLRNHSEDDTMDGLCGSSVDNKFAAIFGLRCYVWDIDAGPAAPLLQFLAPDVNAIIPFGCSRSWFLDTSSDTLIRGVPNDISAYSLKDGSKHAVITVQNFNAITVSLPLQRIAVSSGRLIAIYETQRWTQAISWDSVHSCCYFLEFCPGNTELLSCYPLRTTIVIWNSLTAERIREFAGLGSLRLDSVRWCDVGKLMMPGWDGNMRILDSTSGEELCCWKAHDDHTTVCGGWSPLNILM